MRAAKLPTLDGLISNGEHLRRVTARSISQAEVYAKRGNVLPPSVAKLQAFADAITAALTAIKALPASIAVPAPATLTSGAPTAQLVVNSTPLSGSVTNVAATALYTSATPAAITVSATGLLTRIGVGTSVITVQYGNKFATFTATAT